MTTEKPGFSFAVDELFEFAEGTAVLLGRVIGVEPNLLAPSTVDLVINGEVVGQIKLDAERLPRAKDGRRSVETRAELPVAAIRSGHCILRSSI